MGADGHILLVDTKKAEKVFGKGDWEWFCENAPTCVYQRELNGLQITTFYWGDNMYSSFSVAEDWCEYSDNRKADQERARKLIPKLQECRIDEWEVWT